MANYLKYFPKPFLEDLVGNKCFPIIGAGFSKNAVIPNGKTMPDWFQLGKMFTEELVDYQYVNTLDSISSYAHEYSRVKLVEKLHEYLLVDSVTPGVAHKKFAELQFNIVVTTNFEFLLEKSYESIKANCIPIIDENQLSIDPKGARVRLLKLHGDLNHPNRLVATEEDYDKFIEKYPLIATFLSNLLIEKTPFFIGYSLDDPDFRQIFQIIKERLGNLRRPAYTLSLNAQPQAIARFERRGVKVINIPTSSKDYSKILADIFVELKEYWMNKLLELSTSTEEESLAELQLPKDSTGSLCLFLLPIELISFYKSHIFPVVEQNGFIPILPMDVISPGENWYAKVTALIERSVAVIADLSSENVLLELRAALSTKDSSNILTIIDEEKMKEYEKPTSIVYSNEIFRIYRTKKLLDDIDSFKENVNEWFSLLAKKIAPQLLAEPERLLRKKEYKAAVISVFTLFENMLRSMISQRSDYKNAPKGFYPLFDNALRYEIVYQNEIESIQQWTKIRNQLVHSLKTINGRQATSIIKGIMKIIRRNEWNEI